MPLVRYSRWLLIHAAFAAGCANHKPSFTPFVPRAITSVAANLDFVSTAPGARGPNLHVLVDATDLVRLRFDVTGGDHPASVTLARSEIRGFHILSRGAAGVAGRTGLHGAPGPSGRLGSSALCPNTPAEPGGDGGDGGPGGDGGDGGPGGDGGDIVVELRCAPESCAAARALVSSMVFSDGGSGGAPGRGGWGGSGGASGRGGLGASCAEGAMSRTLFRGSDGLGGATGVPGTSGRYGPPGKPGRVELHTLP